MVPLSIIGLNWCQHAGWMLVLYDSGRGRRLQITLRLEDALVVGQELARQRSDRSALYTLVGTLLGQQPHLASVGLMLADGGRASAALVLHADAGQQMFSTSTADAVALAIRVGLPILAEETLMDTFGVGEESDLPERAAGIGEEGTAIPRAFRLALDDPPGGDAA
jgi:bifunctional DNase/RNase